MINVRRDITALEDDVIELRRKIHKNPEPGLEEIETSRTIRDYFRDLGADVKTDIFSTAVVVDIEGQKGDKCYAFRADMDGLPVEERTGLEFSSTKKGMMHACGHDGHMAALAGFGRYLLQNKNRLTHNVRLIFQPAEEGPGGAQPLVEAGVLENPKVDGIFGLHLYPDLEEGKIGIRPGPMMARTQELYIDISGKSSHGAQPHKGKDAVVAAAHMIAAYQSIVSRSVDPMEYALFTIGRMVAGERMNVIAREAKIEGTMRTFRTEDFDAMLNRVTEITEGIGRAFGCETNIKLGFGMPAVVNDDKLYRMVYTVAGDQSAELIKPVMMAEDFSYYQQKVPGAFFMLGTANSDKGYVHPLHSCYFNFDERVLSIGVEMYIRILEALGGIK